MRPRWCEARARAQGKALAALVPACATLVLAWGTRRRRRTRMHRRRRRTRERLPVALCNHAKPLFAMRREGLGVRRKQAPVGELSAMKGKARWACLRPEQAARARPSVALRNHAKPLWQCDGKGLACVESESKRRWVRSAQWRGKGQACWAGLLASKAGSEQTAVCGVAQSRRGPVAMQTGKARLRCASKASAGGLARHSEGKG